MRLAIADPPYPPHRNGRHPRASRWYGSQQLSAIDKPADVHPDAAEWDEPERHRRLLLDLADQYDGWAIATSADGVRFYEPLPSEARIMAWVKPNAQTGSHRLHSLWEAVIVFPPAGRRSNRNGVGMVPNVLTACVRPVGFIGSKPPEWTRWVLDALGHRDGDEVVDLFPGSGAVSAVLTGATA